MSDIDKTIAENIAKSLGEIPHPSLPKGSNIYGSTKIFPDYKAENGESYFTLVHGELRRSAPGDARATQGFRVRDVLLRPRRNQLSCHSGLSDHG